MTLNTSALANTKGMVSICKISFMLCCPESVSWRLYNYQIQEWGIKGRENALLLKSSDIKLFVNFRGPCLWQSCVYSRFNAQLFWPKVCSWNNFSEGECTKTSRQGYWQIKRLKDKSGKMFGWHKQENLLYPPILAQVQTLLINSGLAWWRRLRCNKQMCIFYPIRIF